MGIYFCYFSHYNDAEAVVEVWLLSTCSIYPHGVFLTRLICSNVEIKINVVMQSMSIFNIVHNVFNLTECFVMN